jgi:hypothetical protein
MPLRWGRGGIVPSLLTSALDGNEWSASRPCRFTPDVQEIGGCLEPHSWAGRYGEGKELHQPTDEI